MKAPSSGKTRFASPQGVTLNEAGGDVGGEEKKLPKVQTLRERWIATGEREGDLVIRRQRKKREG